jgi:hypothetical protein
MEVLDFVCRGVEGVGIKIGWLLAAIVCNQTATSSFADYLISSALSPPLRLPASTHDGSSAHGEPPVREGAKHNDFQVESDNER